MVTKVMGILNVTPDSFSDGGRLGEGAGTGFILDLDKVLFKVENMIKDGADIIDVGGESTRPGFEVVPVDDELRRVIPVIEAIKKNFDVSISLDTYKGIVAKEGIKAGIDIVNDIGMLSLDNDMLDVIKESKVDYVLMHNKEGYLSLFDDMQSTVDEMVKHGVERNRIILDPGIGFNKNYEQNLLEIKNMGKLKDLNLRTLLGVSNKSVIGNALNLPVGERLEGTIALSVMAVMSGIDIVRVHDVKSNVRAIRMTEAVLFSERN